MSKLSDLEERVDELESTLTQNLRGALHRIYVLETFCRECLRAQPHEIQRGIYRTLHMEGNTGIRQIADAIGESGAKPFRDALKGFVDDLPFSPRARMGDC